MHGRCGNRDNLMFVNFKKVRHLADASVHRRFGQSAKGEACRGVSGTLMGPTACGARCNDAHRLPGGGVASPLQDFSRPPSRLNPKLQPDACTALHVSRSDPSCTRILTH